MLLQIQGQVEIDQNVKVNRLLSCSKTLGSYLGPIDRVHISFFFFLIFLFFLIVVFLIEI